MDGWRGRGDHVKPDMVSRGRRGDLEKKVCIPQVSVAAVIMLTDLT